MFLLKNLILEELSLVDVPANPGASVSICKRSSKTKEVNTMANDQTKKVDVEALEDSINELKAENERLRKGLIENGFVIKAETIEKKAEPETIEIDGEMVVKADIPAPVLKRLEAAEEERKEVELTKRCEELLPNIKQDHAKVLLKAIDAEDEEILEFLRAVDNLFSEKMEEVGKAEDKGDMADPETALDELVKSYMEENSIAKKDYAKAYAAVAKTEKGKSLIHKIYKGE